MTDLLDVLDREQKAELKQIKIVHQSEDYSDAYKKVVFERYALRKNNNKNNDKYIFNFQNSLDSLIQRGYLRHPRPNEVFSLLCAYLEGDLFVKNIAEDMLNNYGEWFSLAMKYQNNLLHCYNDPDFEYDKKCMLYNLKSYNSEMLFSISELDEKIYFSIKELHTKNSEFVEFLWSRLFHDLPLQIRENSGLFIRGEGNIWPAGRGNVNDRYDVCCVYSYGASRGVQKKV